MNLPSVKNLPTYVILAIYVQVGACKNLSQIHSKQANNPQTTQMEVGSCRNIFLEALSFPSEFTALIDSKEVKLKILSAGGAGVVFKNEDSTKVYKFAHNSRKLEESRTLSSQEVEIFANATHLFELEKGLFIDLANNKEAIGDFGRYLVPSRMVAVEYQGQIFDAIEKEYIPGDTIDTIYRKRSRLIARNGMLKLMLKDFYDRYKTLMQFGYRVSDVRDPNIIFSPNREPALVLIDGAYDGYISPAEFNPLFDFEELCRGQIWCLNFLADDPDFAD